MRIRKPNLRPIPDDLPDSFPLFPGSFYWQANRAMDYRQRVATGIQVLHTFLTSRGILVNYGLDPDTPERYDVNAGDVTETGLRFLWMHIHGYLEHLDATGKSHNREYLDECWERFTREKEVRDR